MVLATKYKEAKTNKRNAIISKGNLAQYSPINCLT